MSNTQIDKGALFTLGYGLYVVSSHRDGRLNGQIANAVMQVTSTPPKIAVAINKDNLTHEYISHSSALAITILSESAPMKLIGLFGFRSGRDVDKFAEASFETLPSGCPFVKEHSLAYIDAQVEAAHDSGTHTIFIARVIGAQIIEQGKPMSYAYYSQTLRGKTPPTAPTYKAQAPFGNR